MDILWETLGFAAKGGVVFIVVAACAVVVFGLSRRGKAPLGHIKVDALNDSLRRLREAVRRHVMQPKAYKKHVKALNKSLKKQDERSKAFVLDFEGDVMATGVDNLRAEVTALVDVASEGDEVIIRVESPGGVVHGYGLAASQLVRLKNRGIKLTVCVDKVAASGGYMMACVADKIIAAPFAIVGSIGVAAPVPNVNRLLDKHGVDYEDMTAGEYKRTVSVFAKITDKGRQKFQEQIDETHDLFKGFVKDNRPSLDIDSVSTGEYWHGLQALDRGLVDELLTSDDYLISKIDDCDLYKVKYTKPQKLRERLAQTMRLAVDELFIALRTRGESSRYV